ncbi:hypothetical protein [Protaetiibacter larvae]|uniref:Uncharacterized protein n=1 Tax=Protaetiibacter larvae TaxID=2592654 RepID=A0A5C1Y4F0_9MICO|nr:hypothetical protein [Protaetiibacter larvae]QEO08626.1 hypothetical protein FLP23_00415 [Protaetiibacter larvae]
MSSVDPPVDAVEASRALDDWFLRLSREASRRRRGSSRGGVLVRRARTARRLVRELGVRTTAEVLAGELRKVLRR